MAAVEAIFHVTRESMPRVRTHKDGRRVDVRGGPEGASFTLTGDPIVVRVWLERALRSLPPVGEAADA